jgi:transposase-like protein
VIEVLDADAARRSLAAGRLRCPRGGRLRAWGQARRRRIQHADGRGERVRPNRARCRSCGRTHVLLPAGLLPARGYGLDIIAVALLGAAHGRGHRTLAAQLQVPAATVRGWLRRARSNAEALRQFAVRILVAIDPELLPTRVRATRWAEALQTLVAAALAVAHRFGANERDLWPVICVLTGGRLLSATPPP